MARIGLIGELKFELPNVIPYTKSKHVQKYNLGDNEIGVITSGIGQKRARGATERLCDEFNPDYLIFMGFCGGADSSLKIGTLILGEKIYYKNDAISLKNPAFENVRKCLENSGIEHRVGCFQTFDSPVLSRQKLMGGVIGVDMEAYAIAEEALKRGVPPTIIKSVSDILPEHKPLIFPTLIAVARIILNSKEAKKSIDEFGQAYFYSNPSLIQASSSLIYNLTT